MRPISFRVGLGALVALLTVGVVGREQCWPQTAAHAGAAAGPKVQIVNPVYDFGTVMEGEKVAHTFTVKNVGTKDLILNGMKTSCGCTAAAPSTNRVAPGGESQIAVTFDTHFQKGHRERTITAFTNDPSTPSAIMTLQGDVKVEVEAAPSEVSFGKVHYGAEATQEVAISDLSKDSKGFKVGPVSNTSHDIKVTQEPRKDGKPGAILKVTLPRSMGVQSAIGKASLSMLASKTSPSGVTVTSP